MNTITIRIHMLETTEFVEIKTSTAGLEPATFGFLLG